MRSSSSRNLKVSVTSSASPTSRNTPPDSPQAGQTEECESPRSLFRTQSARLGLSSPREYRHRAERAGRCDAIDQSLAKLASGGGEDGCVKKFSSSEVRDLIPVGDKIWAAERRGGAVTMRSAQTGEVLKEIRPPLNRSASPRDKEFVFPWCLLHVKVPEIHTCPEVQVTRVDDPAASLENLDLYLTNGSFAETFPGRLPKNNSIPGIRRVESVLKSSFSKRTLKKGAGSPSMSPASSPRLSATRRAPPSSASPVLQSLASPGQVDHSESLTIKAVDEVWVGYSNGTIRCYCAKTGALLEDVKEQGGGVYALCQWGRFVYSGSNDWTIRKWDAHSRSVVGQFLPGESGHSHSVRTLAICREDVLASGSDDFTIRLWDHIAVGEDFGGNTGRCTKVLSGHKASVLTVAWDGKHLWSAGEDSLVMVWDIDSGSMLRTFKESEHVVTRLVSCTGVSRMISTSVDNKLQVYNTSTLDHVATLEGHTGFVHTAAVVATELRYVLWSSGQDERICVWRVTGDGSPKSASPFASEMSGEDSGKVLNSLLAEEMAKHEALRKEVDGLKNRLSKALEDLGAVSAKYQALSEEKIQQDQELSILREENDWNTAELDKYRKAGQEAAQDSTLARSRMATLEKELAEKNNMLDRMQRELDLLRAENGAYKKDLQDRDSRIASLQREVDSAKDIAAAAAEKERSLKAQLKNLENDLADEQRRATSLLLENQGEETRASKLREQLNAACEERDRMKALVDELRNGLAAAQGKGGILEKRLWELEGAEDGRRVAVEEVAKLRRQLHAECEAVRRAELRAEWAEGLVGMLNARNAELLGMAASAAEAIKTRDRLRAQRDRLEKQLKAGANRIPSLEEANNRLENDLLDALRERDLAEKLRKAAEQEAERLRTEGQEARDFAKDLSARVRGLEDEIASLMADHRNAASDLTSARASGQKAETENKALKEQLGGLQAENRELKGRNKALEEEHRKLLDDVDNLKKTVKALQDANGELRRELEEAKRRGEALEGENKALAEGNEKLKACSNLSNGQMARIARSEEVIADLKKRLANAEDRLAAASEGEGLWKQKYRDLEKRYNEVETELSQVKRDNEAIDEEFGFILRSRTDFIQSVWDWLSCSTMAKRSMSKISDRLASEPAVASTVAAVEGAWKRGVYTFSNYVSEVEKHHLGVSPTMYRPDPMVQAMFKANLRECKSFLKGAPLKDNAAAITSLDISGVERSGTDDDSSRRRAPPRAKANTRNFTPPAAYRKWNTATDGTHSASFTSPKSLSASMKKKVGATPKRVATPTKRTVHSNSSDSVCSHGSGDEESPVVNAISWVSSPSSPRARKK